MLVSLYHTVGLFDIMGLLWCYNISNFLLYIVDGVVIISVTNMNTLTAENFMKDAILCANILVKKLQLQDKLSIGIVAGKFSFLLQRMVLKSY